MKQIYVYFNEKVCQKYIGDKFNKQTKKWEFDVECENWDDSFVFSSLKNAKSFIKKHIDKYKGSNIVKIWANGDWENLGEIKLNGNNKHFIANTKQKKFSY